ncbi:MAG: hypothetical protein AAF958_08005 [Planctomycetota bacterium]
MKRLFTFLLLATVCTGVHAHFPWMMVDKEGRVEYFFGEGMTEKTYKLPGSIAKAEVMMRVDGKLSPVKTSVVESDDFIGLRSVASVPKNADLISTTTFGVYHGAKLQYYTQHLGSEMPKKFSDCKPFAKLDLQAHAVDTDKGVEVYVLWKGKPLEGAEVKLYCDEGHEEGNETTDKSGKVFFNDKQVEDGMNAIMVGHTLSDEKGKFGDESYKSSMHYLTTTFVDPADK